MGVARQPVPDVDDEICRPGADGGGTMRAYSEAWGGAAHHRPKNGTPFEAEVAMVDCGDLPQEATRVLVRVGRTVQFLPTGSISAQDRGVW